MREEDWHSGELRRITPDTLLVYKINLTHKRLNAGDGDKKQKQTRKMLQQFRCHSNITDVY